MRKIFFRSAAAFFLAAVTANPLPAIGIELVLDQANLLQAIDTLYATYDHITQTIE
jgi:hypothetical protein